MTEFTIMVAEIPVRIRALYPATETFCQAYLTEQPPVWTVTSSEALIRREQDFSDRQALLEGRRQAAFSEPYLEQLAIYRMLADMLVREDVLLFHGSAIAIDGQTYLFAAKSGVGKSTHSRLWRKRFGERAVMVNDDKPLLKVKQDGIVVCGTPWNGKERLGSNVILPLKAICFLQRADANSLEALSSWDALPRMLEQSYLPPDEPGQAKALELIDQILHGIPAYLMHCNNYAEDAAEISYEGMNKGG